MCWAQRNKERISPTVLHRVERINAQLQINRRSYCADRAQRNVRHWPAVLASLAQTTQHHGNAAAELLKGRDSRRVLHAGEDDDIRVY